MILENIRFIQYLYDASLEESEYNSILVYNCQLFRFFNIDKLCASPCKTISSTFIKYIFIYLFTKGMVTAAGISMFQFVDLSSSRNLLIIGLAFMLGIGLPTWVKDNPNAINTGIKYLNFIILNLIF